MIIHRTQVKMKNVTPERVYRFLIEPTDDAYHTWWPGVHDSFHIVKRAEGKSHQGDIVFMDERVGRFHLRSNWKVVVDEPAERIVWQMHRFVDLPAYLDIATKSQDGDTILTHVVRVGWPGLPGLFTDPLLRLYFSPAYQADLTDHAQEEFGKLAQLLNAKPRV